ncbi:MAG: hypothetical protein IJ333_04255, partial [Clostridia bacterium]|nr:hypothetical protein [Clostridia bacterium]
KRQVSTETCRFQLYSPYGELYAPSVRDICFASDMPAGVRGEYNITETLGFNITFAMQKYHSDEVGISLKTQKLQRLIAQPLQFLLSQRFKRSSRSG